MFIGLPSCLLFLWLVYGVYTTHSMWLDQRSSVGLFPHHMAEETFDIDKTDVPNARSTVSTWPSYRDGPWQQQCVATTSITLEALRSLPTGTILSREVEHWSSTIAVKRHVGVVINPADLAPPGDDRVHDIEFDAFPGLFYEHAFVVHYEEDGDIAGVGVNTEGVENFCRRDGKLFVQRPRELDHPDYKAAWATELAQSGVARLYQRMRASLLVLEALSPVLTLEQKNVLLENQAVKSSVEQQLATLINESYRKHTYNYAWTILLRAAQLVGHSGHYSFSRENCQHVAAYMVYSPSRSFAPAFRQWQPLLQVLFEGLFVLTVGFMYSGRLGTVTGWVLLLALRLIGNGLYCGLEHAYHGRWSQNSIFEGVYQLILYGVCVLLLLLLLGALMRYRQSPTPPRLFPLIVFVLVLVIELHEPLLRYRRPLNILARTESGSYRTECMQTFEKPFEYKRCRIHVHVPS